jgi:hypothetical protein
MNDDTVIPPVEAGQIESSLEFEYDHERYGDGGFEATGEHAWTFDTSAYHAHTGLDIGADLPYVAQANGHTLRIVTEYVWMHSEYNGTSYSLGVKQTAYRGTTSYDAVYWTRWAHYKLEPLNDSSELIITRCSDEKQRYRMRESEKDVPHKGALDLTDIAVENSMQFVRDLHNGVWGEEVRDQLQALIVADSPDDARPADTYISTETETVTASD